MKQGGTSMAGPFFGGDNECMHVFHNEESYPFYLRQYDRQRAPVREPEIAGLYLQSTRPPDGTSERIFSGGTLPLESPVLLWGKSVRWDNAAHSVAFCRDGLYELTWLIPTSNDSGRAAVVELQDYDGIVYGRSACRSGVLSGTCVVNALSGARLRLVNASSYPLCIASYGANGQAVAGTLTVKQIG